MKTTEREREREREREFMCITCLVLSSHNDYPNSHLTLSHTQCDIDVSHIISQPIIIKRLEEEIRRQGAPQ